MLPKQFDIPVWFQVLKYVSILNLIIEGNIIAAKKVATNIWDEAIFGPEDAKEHVDSHPDANYMEGRWTSVQHAEAASVLLEIMQEKPKKCNECKKNNPKLESSTFCWLEMVFLQLYLCFLFFFLVLNVWAGSCNHVPHIIIVGT